MKAAYRWGWVLLAGVGVLLWKHSGPHTDRFAVPGVVHHADTMASSPAASAALAPAVSPAPAQSASAAARPVLSRVMPPPDVAWLQLPPEPEFARFHDWADRYLQAKAGVRRDLEQEGVALAQARRGKLSDMIEADPKRALELAVPQYVRRILPDAILAELEIPVSGVGDFTVRAAVGLDPAQPGVSSLQRDVFLGGQQYRAFVYGEREAQPTFFGIPLHGIALDTRLALAESPVRLLEAGEAVAPADPVCTISGAPANVRGTPLLAAAGDGVVFLCGTGHAEVLHDRLLDVAYGTTDTDASGARQLRSASTEGSKRVIFIRVDFPDLSGAPFSNLTWTNMLAGLNRFYREQSYGRLGFREFSATGSALTAVLRMPRTAAYYGARDAADLRTDARAAATRAGFNLANHDLDVICMGAVRGFGFAGLGYIGAPGAWIRNAFDSTAGVIAHELGHNLGLYHANSWDTHGISVVGAGANMEYGDIFDTMGNSAAGPRHFNVRSKNFLNWLPNAYVRRVTADDTYRLFAMDSTNGPTTVRALTIRYNIRSNYWMELRQKFTSNKWSQHGVGLHWGRNDAAPTLLLDTTPGSVEDRNDSAIVIGRTYSDRALGIHITPLQRGGTDPLWIDVAVRFGQPTNDLPPTVVVTSSRAVAAVNSGIMFDAMAMDPDDTDLAYAWDFGDGNFGPNQPQVTKAFNPAGEYLVRCTVSDLRGRTASGSVLVRVGSPNTVRIAGRVTRNGLPLEGVRVSVSVARQTFTDTDGSYLLAGLARGTYTVKADAEGLLFGHPSFSNPISVQANRTGVDFEASERGDLFSLTVVPLGADWRYYDKGSLPPGLWKNLSYDDSGWSEGAAKLGYGFPDVVTRVSFGPNPTSKFITTWFRHRFLVDDPRAFLSANLGIIRDDGAAVYLNGKDVFRSNMPTGPLGPATLASSVVGGADESRIYETELDPALLKAGENVLAVELHQASASSADLGFSLQLQALLVPLKRPTVTVARAGDSPRFSWPVAAVGFTLEEAEFLEGPWTGSGLSVQTSSGENHVTVPPGDSDRFFRLLKP